MNCKRKQCNTGALKTSRVQADKKQRTTVMISVPSPSKFEAKKYADHQDSVKVKLSQGRGLISKQAGEFEKINDAQENTCPNSSSSCGDVSGDLVCCVNKIRVVDVEQVVKKALQAAKKTSRFAEIFSKSKARNADLQNKKERERQREVELKEKEAVELRKKQREAARIALEMMEKTVEIEDNLMVMKEFEMLIRSPAYAYAP